MADAEMIEPIRVVGFPGSIREPSYTRMAVEIALRGAQEAGAETQLLDLRNYRLSLLEEEWDKRDSSPNVLKLRRDIQSAHGIILGTPEYHGSFSGIIKYAIDLMGFDEFEGKLIGLVGVAGGKLGASESLNSLRSVGRALHAWVVPLQVSIPEAWRKFSTDGTLKDPQLEERLLDVGKQVTRFAKLHHSPQFEEFVHQWETAPENPAGSIHKRG